MPRFTALLTLCTISLFSALLGGCAATAQSLPPSNSAAQNIGSVLLAQGYTPIALRRVGNGLDTVSLRVNGTVGTFLLDTGASNSVIDSRALPRFNISAPDRLRIDTAVGAGGQVSLSSYAISGLSVSGKNFFLPEISATNLSSVISAFARDTGLQLDGIIGQDVMIIFDGVIDTKNQTLFLRQR